MLFGIEWDTSSHWAFAVSILPILGKGLLVTLQATVVGFLLAAGLGLVLAGLKGMRSRLIAWPARFISEFLRDTPLLVQLFFLYYVLPDYGLVLPAFMTVPCAWPAIQRLYIRGIPGRHSVGTGRQLELRGHWT